MEYGWNMDYMGGKWVKHGSNMGYISGIWVIWVEWSGQNDQYRKKWKI